MRDAGRLSRPRIRATALIAPVWAMSSAAWAYGPGVSGQLSTTLVRIDHGVISFHGDVEVRITNEAATLGRIAIHCVSMCEAAYDEELDGSPLAIVATPDLDKGEEIVAVVFEGATTEFVYAYHVTPTSIRRVLAEGTNGGWPSARTDVDGRAVIVVPERVDVGSGQVSARMEKVFRWNGHAFDVADRPVTRP